MEKKKERISVPSYTLCEELVNSISHGIAAAFSIWEWTGNDVNDNTVTVYMKRIREKLDSDIIITLKGMGYRIDEK